MLRNLNRIFWLLLLAALLAGCAAEPRTVTFAGERYTVESSQSGTVQYKSAQGKALIVTRSASDSGAHVIAEGQVYAVTGTADRYTVRFPDGREVERIYQGSGSSGGTALGVEVSFEDWDRTDELRQIVFFQELEARQPGGAGHTLASLFVLVLGLLSVTKPRLAWQISEGWKYQNVEPSDLYLTVSRVVGAALVILGLVLLVVW